MVVKATATCGLEVLRVIACRIAVRRLPSDERMSSEIAGVTVIHVCREQQNSQNTSPPNKLGSHRAAGIVPRQRLECVGVSATVDVLVAGCSRGRCPVARRHDPPTQRHRAARCECGDRKFGDCGDRERP